MPRLTDPDPQHPNCDLPAYGEAAHEEDGEGEEEEGENDVDPEVVHLQVILNTTEYLTHKYRTNQCGGFKSDSNRQSGSGSIFGIRILL